MFYQRAPARHQQSAAVAAVCGLDLTALTPSLLAAAAGCTHVL